MMDTLSSAMQIGEALSKADVDILSLQMSANVICKCKVMSSFFK